MLSPESPLSSDYKLEYKTGQLDAMGKSAWQPLELTWPLFVEIMHSVVAWAPLTATPDELP